MGKEETWQQKLQPHFFYPHPGYRGTGEREGGGERESVGGGKEEGRKVASKLDGGDVHPPCLLLKFL